MNLTEKINAEIMTAMRAKDAVSLRGLRAIKAAILLANTDGTGKEMDEEREIALLQRLIKQRKESLLVFQTQNRPELAQIEEEEIAVIMTFLPQQLDREAVEAIVKNIIAAVGASSMKDMGKVMGAANKELGGKAEGKLISEVVKALLQ